MNNSKQFRSNLWYLRNKRGLHCNDIRDPEDTWWEFKYEEVEQGKRAATIDEAFFLSSFFSVPIQELYFIDIKARDEGNLGFDILGDNSVIETE